MTTREKMELIEKYRGNSLADLRPDLEKEWHPTKNGDLTPKMVSVSSDKRVWWAFPYDDPKTGKHFDFEWEARIASRSCGNGCPVLSGKLTWQGFNDLATTDPELVAQWHPTKNGDLTPTMITRGSHKKIWWFLPYDDTKTGKHFDFEWEASISERTRGHGCPFLSGHMVWQGFNDLASVNPQIASEWHPTKNGGLTPCDVTSSSPKKVWWFLPYFDTETGKHFNFEWETTVAHRVEGNGCPFLSGRAVLQGFNDLATVYPELAKQWHPTKNGNKKPSDVLATSTENVWWLLPYDDPKTGKRFDFEWKTSIRFRARGTGCPFLCGKSIQLGFNDLASVNPALASEWHPTKNGNLTPYDVTASAGKSVWWVFSYDDPQTGKHFDFEWKAPINVRAKGIGCPFLCGKAVWPGFNDLETANSILATQWHPTRNSKLTPRDVTYGSHKKVWWICENGHEWRTSINGRRMGRGCPCCNISKGEARMSKFCETYNIISQRQYKFDDCVHKRSLPFDMAIFHKNGKLAFLVEYDGEQHFKPVDFSGKNIGMEILQDTKVRDNVKNEYCKNNRIPLVRISYKDYDNIETVLLKKMVRHGLM